MIELVLAIFLFGLRDGANNSFNDSFLSNTEPTQHCEDTAFKIGSNEDIFF